MIENLNSGAKLQELGLLDDSVYGFWSYMVFLDGLTRGGWEDIATMTGTGMGAGFIGFSMLLRILLLPQGVYGQVFGSKMGPLR